MDQASDQVPKEASHSQGADLDRTKGPKLLSQPSADCADFDDIDAFDSDSSDMPAGGDPILHLLKCINNKGMKFNLSFYALDRQGRLLGRDPFHSMTRGCKLSTSSSKLSLETDVEALDQEISAVLLARGGPLPRQVAMYGKTSWGLKHLQVAVADGTLNAKDAGLTFIEQFLTGDMPNLRETVPETNITPQLTSLQVGGRPTSLSDLVARGYLDPDGIDSLCPTFTVDVMFDELGMEMQSRLPDTNMATPYETKRCPISGDCPVDVQVDVRNVLRLNLETETFDLDFDVTFQWLVPMMPSEVNKTQVDHADDWVDYTSATVPSPEEVDENIPRLWRPRFDFLNRFNDEVGNVQTNFGISQRQRSIRGMRLTSKQVDHYWPHRTVQEEPMLKRSSILSFEEAPEDTVHSVSDILRRMIRKPKSGSSDPNAHNSGGGKTEDGVTELAYKVRCRGVRFSLELNLSMFPFDVVTLPIQFVFREACGIYQSQVLRIDGGESDVLASINASGEETDQESVRKAKSFQETYSKVHPDPNLQRLYATQLSVAASEALKKADEMQSSLVRSRERMKEAGLTVPPLSCPTFVPTLDFVPIPGRMRLRLAPAFSTSLASNTHRLRSENWLIEDHYIQTDDGPPGGEHLDAVMQINVRPQTVDEQPRRVAQSAMTIRIHVNRRSSAVLNFIYLPLLMMTLVSFTTILVGYGFDLVSEFGSRCTIPLTLLLTIVAMELPRQVKEVAQVVDLKQWAFNNCFFIILKDMLMTCLWWSNIAWRSPDKLAITWAPWEGYSGDVDWWVVVWTIDSAITLLFFLSWCFKVYQLILRPRSRARTQRTPSAVRFDRPRGRAEMLREDLFRRSVKQRAASFLHDKWREEYRRNILKERERGKKKRESVASFEKAAGSIGRNPELPVVSKRRTSVRTILADDSTIPPRWKSVVDFSNPPNDAPGPSDEKLAKKNLWLCSVPGQTDKSLFVNIDQPLSKLPRIAREENELSAQAVLEALADVPNITPLQLSQVAHEAWRKRQAQVALRADEKHPKNKLDVPWEELPASEKKRNFVTVNHILDRCSLAHQLQYTTERIFGIKPTDRSKVMTPSKFLRKDRLAPLFVNGSPRIPAEIFDWVRVGDVIEPNAIIVFKLEKHFTKLLNSDDELRSGGGSGEVDLEDYTEGTALLVWSSAPAGELRTFKSYAIHPEPPQRYRSLIEKGVLAVVPETELSFSPISYSAFDEQNLIRADWIFESDGSCVILDHHLTLPEPAISDHGPG